MLESRLPQRLAVGAALCFSLSCGSRPGPAPAATLVVENVSVIDATGAPAQPGMTVFIHGSRIAGILPAAKTRPPKGVRVIDGTGKFLIPGLWDMHTHMSFWGEEALATNLRYGVLAVRDLGGTREELDRWQAEIEAGTRAGPRIFQAGPYIDGPKEFDDSDAGRLRAATTITVTTPDEARAAVAELKRQGVDTIKTHNTIPKDAFLALAAECKRLDLPLAVHPASSTTTLEEVSDAGATTIEHCEMLTESLCYAHKTPDGQPISPLAALDLLDETYATGLFERFARNGSAYDPCLVAYRTFMQEAVDLAPKDPRYEKAAAGRTKMFNRFVELVGLMKRSGVAVVTGTDFGIRPETVTYPVSAPGSDVHDEMMLFVRAGFTPLEALQAATIVPARILRVADRLGTVEAGKEADLLLLDRDPLVDITNTRRISAVIVRGVVLEK